MSRPGRLAQVTPMLTGVGTAGRSALSSVDHRRPVGRDEPDDDVVTLREGAGSGGTPRFGYELDYFATLTVALTAEVIGDTPAGFQINFFVVDGSVEGPEINALIRPGGSDSMVIRPDGIGLADISITYETDDGSLILNRSGGRCHFGSDCLARMRRREFTGVANFCATPTWSTSAPRWKELNGVQGLGIGRADLDELRVQYDMYLPRVDPRAGA